MTTYAAALAYRGLFALFPFILLVIALLAVLRFDVFFESLVANAGSETRQGVPAPLESVVEPGGTQAEALRGMVRQARKEAGGGLLT